MLEIWGDAGDSSTKWLWNYDNVVIKIFRSLENFALKVGGFWNFQKWGLGWEGAGGYPKWGRGVFLKWRVLNPRRTMLFIFLRKNSAMNENHTVDKKGSCKCGYKWDQSLLYQSRKKKVTSYSIVLLALFNISLAKVSFLID